MSHRREDKGARREERLRREREEAERERRRQRIGYLVASVLVLATIVIVALVVASGGNDKPSRAAETGVGKAATAAGCTVRTFPAEGRDHTESPVTYRTNPPTSGNHNPIPAPDRQYATAPPKENYVHSLEHGRIVLQYRPGSPAATIAGLKAVFDEDPSKMLLFPNNTSMPYAVAATAWTHLLGCPAYNARVPAALRAFRDAYRDRGPEVVP